jgi:hypothetical protein
VEYDPHRQHESHENNCDRVQIDIRHHAPARSLPDQSMPDQSMPDQSMIIIIPRLYGL